MRAVGYAPEFLNELRSRVGLAELIGRRVRLQRRGRQYSGLCRFHSERTPSFYVVDGKGFYHCFGCGTHGDAIGWVMQSDNLGYSEAIQKLAAEVGLAGDKPIGVHSEPAWAPALAETTKSPLWIPVMPVPSDAPARCYALTGAQSSCSTQTTPAPPRNAPVIGLRCGGRITTPGAGWSATCWGAYLGLTPTRACPERNNDCCRADQAHRSGRRCLG